MNQPVRPLRFDRIEGINIIATDADGRAWYVPADLFPEWDEIPQDLLRARSSEANIEEFILPTVQQLWEALVWLPA